MEGPTWLLEGLMTEVFVLTNQKYSSESFLKTKEVEAAEKREELFQRKLIAQNYDWITTWDC
jgi:hypothetical protein